jgi:pyocin large subunit-like protein
MSWAKRVVTGSPTRKLVLLTLADYADDAGVAYPSQQTLAADTELNERSIRRALEQLETRKLVSREARPPLRSGQRQTDLIRLKLDATGQSVRRKQPPDTLSKKMDTESGKQSRNTTLSDRGTDLAGYSTKGDTPPKDRRSEKSGVAHA